MEVQVFSISVSFGFTGQSVDNSRLNTQYRFTPRVLIPMCPSDVPNVIESVILKSESQNVLEIYLGRLQRGLICQHLLDFRNNQAAMVQNYCALAVHLAVQLAVLHQFNVYFFQI